MSDSIFDAISLQAGTASKSAVIALLFIASVIDIKERRIPDKLIIAGAIAGFCILSLDTDRSLFDGFIGGISSGLLLLLIFFLARGGIGLGDVKLFSCTGVFLGIESAAAAMLIAVVFSGVFGLMLICINRKNRKREMPFAPFLLIGVTMEILL